MITYLDPRSSPSRPPVPYTARWTTEGEGKPVTIGLFANGFPDSVTFLGHVRDALADVLPAGTQFVLRNKGNASAVATPDMIAELTGQVDGVVAAYGH